MIAEFETKIIIKGTREEILSMFTVLKKFETETKNLCSISIHTVSNDFLFLLENTSDEKIHEFLSETETEINVTADGPTGWLISPGELKLFEALANVAPKAYFNGQISGITTYQEYSHFGELKNGKLYLSDFIISNDEILESYIADVKKKMTRVKFCKLFKVDKEFFDSDAYYDFLCSAGCDGFPSNLDYDTFMEYCDCSEIEEDEYVTAVKKAVELGIVDFETFSDSINVDNYTSKNIYDPKTKKYIKQV